MIGESNDETNVPHKLLLNDRQVSKLPKAFANDPSVNIELSKTQVSQIAQPGGFLDNLLGSLLKSGLPLMKNVLELLVKSVFILLRLTPAAAADAGIHKKILESGTTSLTISNEEMENIMKINKSLENSGLLLKGVSETIEHEAKE